MSRKGFVTFAMDYEKISAELEEEYTWRYNELSFLQNLEANIESEDLRKKYRKSLIVMLYSHFEGFCKFAFAYYITSINDQQCIRAVLKPPLIAASMNSEFAAYENSDRKCKIFKQTLPDDIKLHRFSRRRDFVCACNDFLKVNAEIPDAVVDTESNLTPNVLKKILFRLGFDISIADAYKDPINQLLGYRNRIAHGDGSISRGIDKKDYLYIKKRTLSVIEDIKDLVAHALRDEDYLVSKIKSKRKRLPKQNARKP